MKKYLHVAVGVIENPQGQILIAKRPDSAHQGGLWEFPGGKVNANETLQQALTRELHEELAINVLASESLIQIRHNYPDKSVFLDVHKVTRFSGEPKGNEGQPIKWVNPSELDEHEFPAANRPIIKAIALPRKMAVTGTYNSLQDFEKKFNAVVSSGIKLIQLRINNFSLGSHKDYLDFAYKLSSQYSVQLQLNTTPEIFFPVSGLPRVGLHLKSSELLRFNKRPVSAKILLGASCHSLQEAKQAEKIGVDYLLLSPVKFTCSHPEADVLGWEKFQEMIESINIPVFALGGMSATDVSQAIFSGAQGIASISEWWD